MRDPRRRRARRLVPIVALALGAALFWPAAPLPVRAADPPPQAAARYLAERHGGSAADYPLVYERQLAADGTVAALGSQGAWAGKLLDPASGGVHAVYVTPDGAVGGPELLTERAAATRAGLAPLELKAGESLRGAVAAVAEAELLPVAVWVEAGEAVATAEAGVRAAHPEVEWLAERPLAASADQARSLRAELWEARRAAYDVARSPAVERVTQLGGTLAYESTSAPLLFADLPAGAVDELAAEGSVLSLDLESTSRETMSTAGPTVSADWTGGAGDQGNGARVAVVEYHNVHTSGDMAGQVVSSYSTSGSLAYASGSRNHPTWVAGAIAGLGGTHRGVAPGADIVSASTGGYSPSLTTDRAIIAAADWAVAPNGGDADVVNTSIAQDTAQGAEEGRRYFDSIGWEDNRVVVGSAGNFGTFGHWDVLSPGTGWNVLTVGGVDDRGTGNPGNDVLWYVPGSNGASYRDPGTTAWNLHGDFNKPNVSAPAVNVQTANGMIGSGTSVAAPIVAGIAAQLVARDATLLSWPEAVRALIMAGASTHTPLPGGGVNADHEGVGTANARLSNAALDGSAGGYSVGSMTAGQTVTRTIGVQSGQRIKVALAWSSHTSGSSNLGKADVLASDLDLHVTGPDGAVVRSLSFDNNYETVEITAGRTGTMTIQVTHDRFETSVEPYALAWTVSGVFGDVVGNPFEADIMWAFKAGITAGCAPGRYCPADAVTREQMASFLVRALALPRTGADFFTDDGGSAHQADINALAAAGIGTGCGGGRFCPGGVVNREQMASFLVRALGLSPSSANQFSDDNGSLHERDINGLAISGITGGCGGSRYCPLDPVLREQMAAFLHRALG